MSKLRTTHRPYHKYFDDTIYFITGRTYKEAAYFNTEETWDIFIKALSHALEIYDIKVYAWVLMPNHYHILLKILKGETLPLFVKALHSSTAIEVNKIDSTLGRKVWYQYWDTCINTQHQFFIRFNYIHINPVNHGLCKSLEDVVSYKYCSYGNWIRKEGVEYMSHTFEYYPSEDYNFER